MDSQSQFLPNTCSGPSGPTPLQDPTDTLPLVQVADTSVASAPNIMSETTFPPLPLDTSKKKSRVTPSSHSSTVNEQRLQSFIVT
jgi:hypothetical protein